MGLLQEQTTLMVEVLLQRRLGLLVGVRLWGGQGSLPLGKRGWCRGRGGRGALNLDLGLGGQGLRPLEY